MENKIWPTKKLGEICDLYQPKTITSKEIKSEGMYKVFGANGVIGYYDKYNHKQSEVLVTCRGATCGTINFSEPKSWVTGNSMVVHPKDDSNLLKEFLFWILKSVDLSVAISGSAQPQITIYSLFASYLIRLHARRSILPKYLYAFFQSPDYWQQIANNQAGATQPNVNASKLSEIKIPLPSVAEQKKIIAYLDSLSQKFRQLQNLQSQTITNFSVLRQSILSQAFNSAS